MLDEKSKYLRRLILRAVRAKGAGHIASAFSLVEILRVLYEIKKPDDIIILSKGHGCLALYAVLVDSGIIPIEELDTFGQKDGRLGGHPPPTVPGVKCHTGALGHGLSIGIGIALAARMKSSMRRVFVVLGDGECNEGSVWEAAMTAHKHLLDNLVVIIDRNELQSSGPTEEVMPLMPFRKKWKHFGFTTIEVDGHHIEELKVYLSSVVSGPICIIAKTAKGKGISFMEGNASFHHPAITKELLDKMEAELE